jgi:hypothetical protein
MSRRSESHDRLLGLAEQVMDHLWLRRISSGPGIRLWDNISAVFPDLETAKAHLSWNMTERVVECKWWPRISSGSHRSAALS